MITLNQAKELSKVLPKNTADMYVNSDGVISVITDKSVEYENPMWSLTTLLYLLPCPLVAKGTCEGYKDKWQCQILIDKEGIITSDVYDTPEEACIELIKFYYGKSKEA